jgi:hypothetical protein
VTAPTPRLFLRSWFVPAAVVVSTMVPSSEVVTIQLQSSFII